LQNNSSVLPETQPRRHQLLCRCHSVLESRLVALRCRRIRVTGWARGSQLSRCRCSIIQRETTASSAALPRDLSDRLGSRVPAFALSLLDHSAGDNGQLRGACRRASAVSKSRLLAPPRQSSPECCSATACPPRAPIERQPPLQIPDRNRALPLYP